jgi:hypothetical protein
MLTDGDAKSIERRVKLEQCEYPDDPHRLTRRFLNKLAEQNERLFYYDGGLWISRYSEDRVEGVTVFKKEIVRQMFIEFIQRDLNREKVRRGVVCDAMMALKATCYTERKI